MNSQAQLTANAQNTTEVSAFRQNLAALVFGVIVIFAVGFLPLGVAHNAAHDTRHALSFPCH